MSSHEPLEAGAKQLAETITAIAKSGEPSDIQDYLHDLLADTDQTAPTNERLAAYYLMTREQIKDLDQRTFEAGEQMLSKFGTNNRAAQERIGLSASNVSHGSRQTLETHDQEVGRYFRGSVEQSSLRQAAHGHDNTARIAVMRWGRPLEEYAGEFNSWRRSQEREYFEFDEIDKRRKAHGRALTQASQVARPNYAGEPKDLSPLIDPLVEATTAMKMLALITEAQKNDTDIGSVLQEYITEERDTTSSKAVTELISFTERYMQGTKSGAVRVGADTEELKNKLRSFSMHGNNYAYTTNTNEATNLYNHRQRSLNDLASITHQVMRQGDSLLNASNEELQQFILRIKKQLLHDGK